MSETWPELARERAERTEAENESLREHVTRQEVTIGRLLRVVDENERLRARVGDAARGGTKAMCDDVPRYLFDLAIGERDRARERIASLMLEEPSKTAGLYAAVDELQREIEQLREVIRRLLYRSGQITPDTPCRCGSTQPAHYCDYAMQAERDALKLVPDA